MERIRCRYCRDFFQYQDNVYLDKMNTIIHKRCYEPRFDFKDKGTLRQIMYKYKFF